MQPLIRRFARELAAGIRASPLRDRIVSVVLLGSAARGEFVRGKSDVDFIVVVRKRADKKPATRLVSQLLNRLDRRLGLRLAETCTGRERAGNALVEALLRMESLAYFGVPFYTISLEDYDLVQNRVRSPRIWLLSTFVGSLNAFLVGLRETGRTIYGEDLLPAIRARLTPADRIALDLQQAFVLLAGYLFLLFDPLLASKHAVKATLYQEEFDLLLLRRHLHGYEQDRAAASRLLARNPFLVSHLQAALDLRRRQRRVSRREAFRFLRNTGRFLRENDRLLAARARY